MSDETRDVGTLLLTVGLPGVGKTTWVREWSQAYDAIGATDWADTILHIERDLIRQDLGIAPGDFSRETWVNAVQDETIREGLKEYDYVIVADTNLRPRYRTRLRLIAAEEGASVLYKVFSDSRDIDLVLKRNRNRAGTPAFVPEDVIRNMHERFIQTGAWLQGIGRHETI